MKFTKENLNLENGLNKEWLITNGIGGYSSSTIIGANTRKYHGLLIAPLTPPARRFLVFSKLDEAIEKDGKKYDLYTNICKNYISKGYIYQEEFDKEYYPEFVYDIDGIKIIKNICMEYGKNTVGIYYKLKNTNQPIKLILAPIVNFRDFHQVKNNHIFLLKQDIKKTKVKMIIDENSQTPVYMHLSEGEYIEHKNDTFFNMYYIEEEKRGFLAEENHAVAGRYEIEIQPNEEKEISFVCSLEENIEEINVKSLMQKERERIDKIILESNLIEQKDKKTKKELDRDMLIKQYIIATDNFVVYRPNFALHTLIAGYPWFLDWGRDSLISFEGLLLETKRYDIAKEVLLTMTRDIKYGLVPNGYSGYDNRPLYNSADASLLLFEQIRKYLDYTQDFDFVKEKLYGKLENIIENYCQGIDVDDNNIYVDSDGLLVSGTEYTQNTWMDAKCNGIAITPRNGKTVELNALWYNANMIMKDLTDKFHNKIKSRKYKKIAEKCYIEFNNKFYNKKKKCLFDVLDDEKIRPNQLFSMSLTYPILNTNSEEAKNVINTVEKKLLNSYGIKTLSKDDKEYVEIYDGDGLKRDSSYHQGITWTWLLGLYYDSLKNMIKTASTQEEKQEIEAKLDKFIVKTDKIFKKEIQERGCIGSISEIYDSVSPFLPRGAFAQGWSVAEIFRIILKK